MKVAIFCESAADEAGIRILVDAVVGTPTEPFELDKFRARRGWPSVPNSLPAVVRHLHYQTEADALVAVVDANGSPLHSAECDPGQADPRCRLCHMRRIIASVSQGLGQVPGRGPLLTAIALAAPAIEAWWLCGRDLHATEVAWERDRAAGASAPVYIRTLKQLVYGTDRPSLPLETSRAEEAARSLATQIGELERHFPIGFGAFARVVRAWVKRAPEEP
jgi:hypothetical protein